MNLLILGATGRTGRLATRYALARGHNVTAFVRTQSLTPHERLKMIVGDPRVADDLLTVLPDQDAVISCLGNAASADRGLVPKSAAAMLMAMGKVDVKRYVAVSGALLFPSMNPLIWVLRMALSAKLADGQAMEEVVRPSNLDWTIVRPPYLTEGDRSGAYHTTVGSGPSMLRGLRFADLADCLLDVVERRQFVRQIVGVGPA